MFKILRLNWRYKSIADWSLKERNQRWMLNDLRCLTFADPFYRGLESKLPTSTLLLEACEALQALFERNPHICIFCMKHYAEAAGMQLGLDLRMPGDFAWMFVVTFFFSQKVSLWLDESMQTITCSWFFLVVLHSPWRLAKHSTLKHDRFAVWGEANHPGGLRQQTPKISNFVGKLRAMCLVGQLVRLVCVIGR